MLNSTKIGKFIMDRRKALGMTQQQLADKLNVSFQAVSKWENGVSQT
ncbi:MAG: helix-turn-helix transcriptional regulator [Clostridia bacterium]|nr:helix-turn-helix transcriptional regulator [Clostridia bacterium]